MVRQQQRRRVSSSFYSWGRSLLCCATAASRARKGVCATCLGRLAFWHLCHGITDRRRTPTSPSPRSTDINFTTIVRVATSHARRWERYPRRRRHTYSTSVAWDAPPPTWERYPQYYTSHDATAWERYPHRGHRPLTAVDWDTPPQHWERDPHSRNSYAAPATAFLGSTALGLARHYFAHTRRPATSTLHATKHLVVRPGAAIRRVVNSDS